jgi:hypothetical protein
MYFFNYASTKLVSTNATTLASAKRAAARNCIFQGQTTRVFEGSDAETAIEVARREADPINMNKVGKWVEA